MEETIRIKIIGERVVICRMVKDAINFIVDECLEHMELATPKELSSIFGGSF
jgi:hypothetical protein